MRTILPLAAAVLGLLAADAHADGDCGDEATQVSFMRDDMVALKDHMKAIVAAIGALPAPYAMEDGNWSLPSTACQEKSGFRPISVRYDSQFSTAGAKEKQEQAQQDLAADYQKKILAAQASGDFQSLQKLATEMQAKAMQQAMSLEQKDPVAINVYTNVNESVTIDPDSVLRDGEGFIALRTNSEPSTEQVVWYFDPVALKNAHQLASFEIGNELRTTHKLDLLNAEISLNGPKEAVDALVKNLDPGKVLSQLSATRTKAAE